MALTESKLRSIIQEEARRVMREGEDKVIRVNYIVGTSAAPMTRAGIKMQEDEAFEKAVERAEGDFPGYEWELRKDSPGSIGMMVHRGARDGDPPVYKVYLIGHPKQDTGYEYAETPWTPVAGEEDDDEPAHDEPEEREMDPDEPRGDRPMSIRRRWGVR